MQGGRKRLLGQAARRPQAPEPAAKRLLVIQRSFLM